MAEYGSCCKQRSTGQSINRIAIAERASLEEVDGPFPYPAIFIQSREDDDDVRDIRKHDFRSVLLHPMLSNANRSILEVTTPPSAL